MVKIGENILKSSEVIFMNLPPYVFDVDHVAKIRSRLSITVPEKIPQNRSKNSKNLRADNLPRADAVRKDMYTETMEH